MLLSGIHLSEIVWIPVKLVPEYFLLGKNAGMTGIFFVLTY